ncbi:uncharacterized protein TNIN_189761 [Trichonephila inaurata madagascariensis]|uniref:Uncharacterized protein n=1 Tax=Trichonephila inaurata madagascariensis TaxID=2747483 RepID=A0A8X6XH11_9ARAC|nr:uncharacterized protein TNIN_189761 [Trichonephila inaurata madagascariensis]
MDLTPTKTEYSFRSISSNSSRCGTPKPAEPTLDCEKRRQAILRLEQQNVLIGGYQKFLFQERNSKDKAGIHKELEKNLRETIEAKAKLVSELRTMPPCLDVNCPDHTTLKPKTNVTDNDIEMTICDDIDKKSSHKRKNSKGPNPSVSSEGFFDLKLNQNVEGVIVCDAPCDSVMNANGSFLCDYEAVVLPDNVSVVLPNNESVVLSENQSGFLWILKSAPPQLEAVDMLNAQEIHFPTANKDIPPNKNIIPKDSQMQKRKGNYPKLLQ